MSRVKTDLVVAGFLDSEEARSIAGVRSVDLRRGALLVVQSLIGDMGVLPGKADGDAVRGLLRDVLPRKVGSKDPLVPTLCSIVHAFFAHVIGTEACTNQYEIEVALAEVDDESFARSVKAVGPDERIGSPVRTLGGRGRKVGRNDPCPCGSGKKFKKCCATLGED